MEESEEKLKSFLMKMKEESEKAGLKLSIHKTNTVTSGHITLWHINEGKRETVQTLLFWSLKSL